MNEFDTILVTGASGRTGRACVAQLVAMGGKVRALVRRPDAAEALIAAGVAEAVVGDMFAADVMRRAIDGALKVLHICPPMHPREDELAAEMMDQAKSAGVIHFVLWSVLHPHIDVPHHRRKQKAEAALIDSGLTFTILQPGRYMQHLESIWPRVCADGLHSFPFSTQSRLSLAHVDDLASVAAQVLTTGGHENAIYELAGPQALSQDDCAAIISAVLGHSVCAQPASLDAFLEKAAASGLPEWRISTLAAMNRHYDAHGLEGNCNVLSWLLGRAPKTFCDYVEELARN